jgi:putative phosphoesterase
MFDRIGVIGDIHAESTRLRIVLDFMKDLNLDAILCVGDIVDGRGDVNECCSLLKKHSARTVLGNHDEWFINNSMRDLPDATPITSVNPETLAFIRSLPIEMEFQTPAGNILLCHGLGRNTMGKVRDDDYGYALENNFELQGLINSHQYKFVINGHSHYKMVRDFGTMKLINAGSLLYEDPCFLIIDFKNRLIQFYNVEESSPKIQKEMDL